MKTALLIIDVQSYFLKDAPHELPDRIAQAIKQGNYTTTAFTVFKNRPTSNFVQSLHWAECMNDVDAQLPDVLDPFASVMNIFMRAHYSGFIGTSLDTYLKSFAIEKVVLCGIDTDACVLATAFHAFDLGYVVDINFGLTFSGGSLDHEAQMILRRNIVARH